MLTRYTGVVSGYAVPYTSIVPKLLRQTGRQSPPNLVARQRRPSLLFKHLDLRRSRLHDQLILRHLRRHIDRRDFDQPRRAQPKSGR